MAAIQQRILATLRNLNMRCYLETLARLSTDRADYDRSRELIAELSSGDDARARLFAYPALTELLKTPEYQGFLVEAASWGDDTALVVQTLLETREYEERIAHLRRESPEEYFDELHVIGEAEILYALAHGTVVNAITADGLPLPIPYDEAVSGSFLDDPIPTASVDADVLRTALLKAAASGDDLEVDPRGLRLRQVVVTGTLDLNWISLTFPLAFQGCEFHGWLWADNFSAPGLGFERCDFTAVGDVMSSRGALNASGIKIERDLRFWDCAGFDQLFIPDSDIGTFSLSHPHDPDAAPASFRTVLDGAHFGVLYFPDDDAGQGAPSYKLPQGIQIDRVEGSLEAITRFLSQSGSDTLDKSEKSGASGLVWDEVADALVRSGRADDATQLRISYKRHVNSMRNPVARFLSWLVLDTTVRYGHRPLHAFWWFAAVLLLTWALAFMFHGQLIKSPLVSEPVPASWLEEFLSAVAWSFMYALDITVAPLSLGQVETMWPGAVWLILVLAILKGISITLLGLFLGAITTLVSKRSAA